MKPVKEGLDKDEKLGVIEKVPLREPVTWCAKMICVPKKDGQPRRTVDFQALNKAAYRQTHATIAPFQQATSIPKDTYKSVLDAWEGYHSIPLDQDDIK